MKGSLSQRLSDSLIFARVDTGARLIVGFSGGRDSVVLVELLLEAGWNHLVLCHLDHGFRVESEADALWAQEYAQSRGVEVYCARRDVGALAKEAGVGLEEAGRAARYGFFSEVSQRLGGLPIVLAHHADDQVETFLFRMLRGAGAAGLGGMAAESLRDEGQLRVLRPMLGIWRREIDDFVRERQLSFREDLSNADPRWTRNRIRHELIPYMESVMQRPVREAMWRTAELLRAENECLEVWTGEMREVEVLSVLELKGAPLALRRRRVLAWLRAHQIGDVGFDAVELILGLLVKIRPARVNLPGGCFVRRRAGQIFLERPEG